MKKYINASSLLQDPKIAKVFENCSWGDACWEPRGAHPPVTAVIRYRESAEKPWELVQFSRFDNELWVPAYTYDAPTFKEALDEFKHQYRNVSNSKVYVFLVGMNADDVLASRNISAQRITASYENHFTRNVNRQRYSVYIDDYSLQSPYPRFQISGIHPYDDAEYTWAQRSEKQLNRVDFYRNGKKIDSVSIWDYDPDYYDGPDEYIDDIIDSIIEELETMNKDVEPRMVHN